MKTVLRALAGVLAGLFVSFLLVIAVEFLSALVHPLPADFGGTAEEMCRYVERYPAWVLAVVVPAWAIVAFAGTWIAQRIGRGYCDAVVGALIVAALLLNLWMLPYPVWFKAANLVVAPVAILVGVRLPNVHQSRAAGMDP